MRKPHIDFIRIAELILLFVLLPVIYWLDLWPFHKIIPLAFLFVYCLAVLVRHNRIRPETFSWDAHWGMIIFRFGISAVVIALCLIIVFDLPLLADFKTDKKLLLMVVIYPIASVLPQELIFRKFFFYRYEKFFKHPRLLLACNVLLFAFAHFYFDSWIVIGFTLIGGLIFAQTYLKSRSLTVVCIEHSLYGLLVLASGLSEHFYKAF